MLYLTESDVQQLLTMDDALALVARGFQHLAAGTAFNQPRRRVTIPGGATLHVLSAGDGSAGYVGLKAYSTSREGAHFTVLLYRAGNGDPLAQIEADYLGQVRTGAASGVATRFMAVETASVLALIGTGKQALTQGQAIARVRQLREIRVYGRDPERRRKFADELSKQTGVPCQPVADARSAVEGAHIVATATNSKQPVVLGDWLEPGMHVNAIGSNHALRAELDPAAVDRAGLIVTDSVEQARMESGELIAAFEDRPAEWERVQELSSVVAGTQPGRETPQQITLFKSNGIGLEDIAVAGYLYELRVKS